MLVRLLVDVLIFKYLSGFGADAQRGLIAASLDAAEPCIGTTPLPTYETSRLSWAPSLFPGQV